MYWEEIRTPRGIKPFRYAVLDFDGTVSLIREGWQQIMIPYFTDELAQTPEGSKQDWAALNALAREMIFFHTGKQTIYQCIALAEEVQRLGGSAASPAGLQGRVPPPPACPHRPPARRAQARHDRP